MSGESTESLARDCVEALHALNAFSTGVSPEGRGQANVFLMRLQNRTEIWEIADLILNTQDLPEYCHYFAANALALRLQWGFGDLAHLTDRLHFRTALLSYLTMQLSSTNIRRRLADCVAILVVHMTGSGEWQTALPDILEKFGNDDGVLSLLEILRSIPEQVHSKRIVMPAMSLKRADSTISQWATECLDVLHSLITSTDNVKLQASVFECFAAWNSNGLMHFNKAVAHPLLTVTYEAAATSRDLLEPACDALRGLFMYFDGSGASNEKAFELITKTLELMSVFDKEMEGGADDHTVLHCIAHVQLELADSFRQQLITNSEVAGAIIDVMTTILSCGIPPVVEQTFIFWERLYRLYVSTRKDIESDYHFCESRPSGEHSDADYDEILRNTQSRDLALEQHKKDLMPRLANAMLSVVKTMQLPDDYLSLSLEEQMEYRDHRYHASEALVAIGDVVEQKETLNTLWGRFQEAYEDYRNQISEEQEQTSLLGAVSCEWQPLEAVLYALRFVHNFVDDRDANMMPTLMNILPTFRVHRELRNSALSLMASYASWIYYNPHVLETLLPCVVSSLVQPSLVRTATDTFRTLCEACSKYLARNYLDILTQVYKKHSPTLSLERQNEMLEALTIVICRVPPPDFNNEFAKLVHPMISDLESAVANVRSNNTTAESAGAVINPATDRLVTVLKALTPSRNDDPNFVRSTCCEMLTAVSPTLHEILELFPNELRIVENVCRCWTHGLQAVGTAGASILPELISLVVNLYSRSPSPAYVYTASVVIKVFARDQSQHGQIVEMMEEYSRITLPEMATVNFFDEEPAIAEDFFNLASRFMELCPDLFISEDVRDMLFAICRAGLNGLESFQRGPFGAVTRFFSLVVQQANPETKMNQVLRREPSQLAVQATEAFLEEFGEPIIAKFLRSIGGNRASEHNESGAVLLDVFASFALDATLGLVTQELSAIEDASVDVKNQLVLAIKEPTRARLTAVKQAVLRFAKALHNDLD